MNLIAVSYAARRHLGQITPVALAGFAFWLLFGIALRSPDVPSWCSGVALVGGGLTLVAHALPSLVLGRLYGIRTTIRGAGTALLGLVLMGMGWEGATVSTLYAALLTYLAAVGMYWDATRQSARYGLVFDFLTDDFMEQFQERLEQVGITAYAPIAQTDSQFYMYQGRSFEVRTFEGSGATCFIAGLNKATYTVLRPLVETMPHVYSLRCGWSVAPGCQVDNRKIQNILHSQPQIKAAYFLGNALCLDLYCMDIVYDEETNTLSRNPTHVNDRQHELTLMFGPVPERSQPFLHATLHDRTELQQIGCIECEDGEKKKELPELVGKYLSLEVIHKGPLDTFGRQIALTAMDNGEVAYHRVSYRTDATSPCRLGLRMEPMSKEHRMTTPVVPLGRYLDFWSSFTPVFTMLDDEFEKRRNDKSSLSMAPRDGFLLAGYDPYDHSRYRIKTFHSLQPAIVEAMHRAGLPGNASNKIDPQNFPDISEVFQVFDQDGKLAFATDLNAPLAQPHFLRTVLRRSRPFWWNFRKFYLKGLVLFYSLFCLGILPLLFPAVRQSVFLVPMGIVAILTMMPLLCLLRDAAQDADTLRGKIGFFLGSVVVFIGGNALLAHMVATSIGG